MASFTVIKPGLATYVQDLGRYGYYHLGIPPGGALDTMSFKAGNLLLGNDINAPALEVSLMAPELVFNDRAYVAITGSFIEPIVNGEKRSPYSVIELNSGDILSFGFIKGGARVYICVKGGIDVPIVLGSASTYPLGGIGGYNGRKLEAGDVLPIGEFSDTPRVGLSLDSAFHVKLQEVETLRVVMGLHDYKLMDESIETLFSDTFNVSSEADRSGYRFKNGNKLKFKNLPQPFGAGSDPSNIPDACYPIGSMQCPGGNEPIILLKDAPSGGGFAMYCTVISSDMDKLGQLPPNHKVRFQKISMDEALQARAEYKRKTQMLIESLS